MQAGARIELQNKKSPLIFSGHLVAAVKLKFLVELLRAEGELKFSSTFFKRWQIPKTASLVALRRVRKAFIVRRIFESLGLKTCFQSTFLQEKKFSRTIEVYKLSPKSFQWEVFGSRNS